MTEALRPKILPRGDVGPFGDLFDDIESRLVFSDGNGMVLVVVVLGDGDGCLEWAKV